MRLNCGTLEDKVGENVIKLVSAEYDYQIIKLATNGDYNK